jgi:hypothetical protein
MTVEEAFRQRLHGAVLIELARLEYWYDGKLASRVNVLFARVDPSGWVRFHFDAGVFFWREVPAPDAPESQGPYSWRLLPAQVPGLRLGAAVDDIAFTGDEGQTVRSLAITLGNGTGFTLRNVDDESVLEPAGRNA